MASAWLASMRAVSRTIQAFKLHTQKFTNCTLTFLLSAETGSEDGICLHLMQSPASESCKKIEDKLWNLQLAFEMVNFSLAPDRCLYCFLIHYKWIHYNTNLLLRVFSFSFHFRLLSTWKSWDIPIKNTCNVKISENGKWWYWHVVVYILLWTSIFSYFTKYWSSSGPGWICVYKSNQFRKSKFGTALVLLT